LESRGFLGRSLVRTLGILSVHSTCSHICPYVGSVAYLGSSSESFFHSIRIELHRAFRSPWGGAVSGCALDPRRKRTQNGSSLHTPRLWKAPQDIAARTSPQDFRGFESSN